MDQPTSSGAQIERRLAVAAVLIACAISTMTLWGSMSSWQYYQTVEECQSGGASMVGKRLRVSGIVAPASLEIRERGTQAAFTLQGPGTGLKVLCRGPLPDNLAENIQVVVEGQLERPGRLRGDRVMTRCASKYEAEQTAQPARLVARGDGSRR